MSIDIPVVVEATQPAFIPSMNVVPILHEVRHALQRLIETGEGSMIDLRAMPLAPGEADEIQERLGTGEASIRIDALGPSFLTETSIPGVWWIEHRNSEDVITGLYIEIAKVPSFVIPETQDLQEGLSRLDDHLQEQEDL